MLRTCPICGREALVSKALGACYECLRDGHLEKAELSHKRYRETYGLPPTPPRGGEVICCLCDLRCEIHRGERGFCGLVENRDGRLVRWAGTPDRGLLEWYYDRLPTNCVAAWFCPGSRSRGYNLAVFYGACNLDCLFCQNWMYKELTRRMGPTMSSKELASKIRNDVACICFFGGDPSTQVAHAMATARMARRVRVCWETNGHFSPEVLKAVADTSIESGGIIKFDLKAWNNNVYKALTGVDLGSVYKNASFLLEKMPKDQFTASTLLIPGYVDEEEVRAIAEFLASFSRDVPYTLLAFHPEHLMSDLPRTSGDQVKRAVKAAREAGLRRVFVGNYWLVSS